MLVNIRIYTLTVIAAFVFRDTIFMIHRKMFGFDEETVSKSMHRYLANYKLLTTVFSFVPWAAILIIS